MKRVLLSSLLLVLFLFSCSKENQKVLNISTNSWIGYAPLFYAKEKGYLKDLNIHLITNVSLGEAADIYDVGKADMVTTTQHEYYSLKHTGHDIFPIILFDRSKGGDMILSNKNLQELLHAKKIYAYLEIDSINAELLEDFIKHYHIDKNKIEFINKDQSQIADLQPQKSKTMLIVTYVPYNIDLIKKGFQEIVSTTDMKTLIVIDALCTNEKTLQNNRARLEELKSIIDRSIKEIQTNKVAAYKLIKPYLTNISYKDYLHSLELIKWINKPSKKLLKRIQPMGYDEKRLLK
jgi:NitT/TauT family transport system substrate-binding protein